MKNLFIKFGFIFILISCNRNDQETPEPTDFGYLSMNISVSITEEPASGRVEAVSTDDWEVTIFDASDDSEVMVFDPYSSAPAEVQLPTGEYYLEAHSNNFQEAAFENPYYFGRSANFTIDKEELTPIDINAELANSKVAINYTSNVTGTFDDYTGTVTVVSSGTTLDYVQGETQEGYFVAEPLSVVVDLSYTKLDGITKITRQFTANIDAQPKTLYNINVDATLEDGKIVLNINVDETFEEIMIELGDAAPDPNTNWITGDDWIDSRDGEVYSTVQIGDQIWMSQNLRYLPEVHSNSEWELAGLNQEPAYGVFAYNGNDEIEAKGLDHYESRGVLYNWWSAMGESSGSNTNPSGVQGVCPANWHVPSDSEWIELLDYYGGPESAVLAIRETGTTNWGIDIGATNESGFSARQTGVRYPDGSFGNWDHGYWWTSSIVFTASPVYRLIFTHVQNVYSSPGTKENGYTMRCVKD